jgi:hypothetical protein
MTVAVHEQRAPRGGARRSTLDLFGHKPTNSSLGGPWTAIDAFLPHSGNKAPNGRGAALGALFFELPGVRA